MENKNKTQVAKNEERGEEEELSTKKLQGDCSELEKQLQEKIAELQQQTKSANMLNSIITKIQKSLNLATVLNTITTELREILECDRVVIYRFNSDWSGVVIAESVREEKDSLKGKIIHDPCFAPNWIEPYQNGRIRAITDIYTAQMADCHIELLEKLNIRAKLLVPIILEQKLWGLITASTNEKPREWQKWEIELLEKLATSISIAISQAELYEQVKTELDKRKKTEIELKKTNKALTQERNFSLAILSSIDCLVVVLNRKGRVISFNKSSEITTGYSLAEVEGKCLWDVFLQGEEQTKQKEIFKQCLQGKINQKYENNWVTKNGNKRLISWSNNVLTNGKGKIEYVIAYGRDITEEKETVNALKMAASQQEVIGKLGRLALEDPNLDVLMEESVKAIAATFKVELVEVLELLSNAAAFRLKAAVGINSGWVGKKIVGAGKQSMAGYTLLSGKSVVVKDLRLETRFGGSPFYHNLGIISGINVLIPGKEKPYGVLGVNTRKQREFNSKEVNFLETIANILASAIERKIAEDELNCFFNLSLDMFCIAGIDGHFKRINPRFAEITGYEEVELLSKPFIDFVHPEDVKDTHKEMEKLTIGFPTVNFANRYICADGSYRWFSWMATPFEDGKLYAVARDITEQIKATEKLQQQALKERLVSQIALDIRRSLKLEEILNTTAKEVRKLLDCDRVVCYKFTGENGIIVAESVGQKFTKTLGKTVEDICSIWGCDYQANNAKAIDNVEAANLELKHKKILEKFEVKASLCVPILTGECPQMWGFLIAHQCSSPRKWQPEELKLLEELAVQLSIAIGQSQLYQQLETELMERRKAEIALRLLNEGLEITVADRTKRLSNINQQLQHRIVDLKQVEYALKQQNLKSRLFAEITLKIRNSLQLEDILQTTVTEVQKILMAERVLMYKIYPDGTGCVFMEEVITPWKPMLNMIFAEEVFPKEYQQLYDSGMIKAIADVEASYPISTPCMLDFSHQWGIKAKLVVPILHNNQLWGFLIAHQCSTPREWTEFEIELMRQLADQVGVAISQAQLLEAQQQSEAQFRAIFQQAAVGIAQATLDGKFLKLNQRFCEIVGYSQGEILNTKFSAITYPPDLEADLNYLKQIMAGEIETFSMEKRYIRKNGSIVWVNLTVSLVRKATGEPDYFIGVIQDISKQKAALAERKRTEEALRYSEERFRIALKNSPIVVFNQDRKLRYTWIYNSGFGIKAEAIIGKTDDEIFLPENAAKLTNIKTKVLKTGVGTREEVIITDKNDLKCFDLTVDPLLNLDGEIIGVTCAALDISDRKKAELALQESQHFIQRITDASPNVLYIYDLIEQRNIYCNRTIATNLGYTASEIKTMGAEILPQLMHPEDLAKIPQHYQRFETASDNDIFEIEYRMGDINGNWHWFVSRDVLFSRTLEGLPKQILGAASDITQSKQAELERRIASERLKYLLASSPGVLYSCEAKGDYQATFVSDNAYNLFGYDQSELKKPGFWKSHIHPEDLPKIFKLGLKSLFQKGYYSHEYRFQHKDGSYRWIYDQLKLVRDEMGNALEIIGYWIDISDRKAVEQKLTSTTLRLATLLENLQLGVLVKDELDKVVLINQSFCDLFNINTLPSELIGTNFSEFPAQIGEFTKEIVCTTETNNEEIILADGRILERDYVPIMVANKYQGHLWMYRDISERKNYELQLKNSLKEKEMLLKEIHHRVKNNLLVVSNLLEFQADYTEDPAIIQLLQDSQNRIYSMALIHEKLYRSTNLAKINFGEYLQDLVDNLFDSYKVWDQQIQFELDLDPIFLNIETAHPCSLVVNELLSNALKHAFPGRRSGKIWIALSERENQEITLTVKDNGIGFPEALDFRNTESLGMELVCTLTEQLEGTIELKREKGTCFELTFTELQYSQRF